MGYTDSQVHSYHYQNDQQMVLRWAKEIFPLPDEIEMKGKSNAAASSGTGSNLTANAAAGSGSTPIGPTSTHIIGTTSAPHGLVNQYWDCFDDEEQWTMFHGLKMSCNGDLYKDGILLGNNFHRSDRVAAMNIATKPHGPSTTASSHAHHHHPNQGSRPSN
ncbi:Swm1p Ecym_5579 [Eremothecium cymbalariae DBVPG|uniref:Uncharacterized protein n=1 Tax=Eremothecium cymbalariae (strain CBS 270.75 / DBVPG 7215 / KCTC 17166 / NRRL Y-17582) TaxID=931890 RepID=I6NE25_ERECY|nr:hypothetical protein Ecym_5579 [Eremothecium cymbalariae DBVPG\